MIIVKIQGGLGNQMFQYALYRKFIYLGVPAKIDIRHFDCATNGGAINSVHQGYQLPQIFDIKENLASQQDIDSIGKDGMGFFLRALRKLGIVKKKYVLDKFQNVRSLYNKNILQLKNAYLDGYWVHYKYWKDIFDTIREDFTFKLPMTGECLQIAEDISASDAVSIHIRRGDYLNIQDIFRVLPKEYYLDAINIMNQKYKNPKFFVFSDDIDWCKSELPLKNATFVSCNNGKNSYRDLQLMSLCKGNVIANSTFSLWAAFLNKTPTEDKSVIAPARYYNDGSRCFDCYMPEWIKINK